MQKGNIANKIINSRVIYQYLFDYLIDNLYGMAQRLKL